MPAARIFFQLIVSAGGFRRHANVLISGSFVLVLVLDLWRRGASMFIRPSADANAPAGFVSRPELISSSISVCSYRPRKAIAAENLLALEIKTGAPSDPC
jgi:hypothetical protein